MTDVLIIGDTFRSPELRNEIPLAVPDPFVYLEHDGTRHVYVGSMEAPRIRGSRPRHHGAHARGDRDRRALHAGPRLPHDPPRVGRARLRATPASRAPSCRTRSRRTFRSHPPGGDRTRPSISRASTRRRRVKTAPRSTGIRRAQRAAEAGLGTGIALLRASASDNDGALWFDGEALTVERVKQAMRRDVRRARLHGRGVHRCARRRRAPRGTRWATGRFPHGVPIVFDLWPRDDVSSCFADMTRTVRRRRCARPGARVVPRDEGGARRGDCGRSRRRRVQGRLRHRLRHLRGSGISDAADEDCGPGSGQRLLPRSRPRGRARGARGAVHGVASQAARCSRAT